eukprot:TRINITY_DN18215_c0_g1_i1.p1 TRINITY_DN18215_c0_g1~~TRINITY_DN18215_c0_g1_i1.p1  ORF type:complete len:345 (+),score=-36.57 TRINITY_DN18215_c0_g1_i1:77-1111(+)
MENLAKKLKSSRQGKGLSVEQVSAATKIRPHLIEAIEECDFSLMPFVYMKSFIITYAEYLNIPYSDSDLVAPGKKSKKNSDENNDKKEKKQVNFDENGIELSEPIKEQNIKKEDGKRKKTILTSKISTDSTDYSEIFKNKKIKSGIHPGLVHYLIYGGVALLLILILYFVFLYDSGNSRADYGKTNSGKSDTVVADNGLLNYFKQSDSLTLVARAFDTAWVKLDIDGKESDEIVLHKGMEKKWSASNYFVLSQGSIGAVEFYRNGEKLPLFGKQGSVAKNIKITKDKISNISPWQGDSNRQFSSVNVQAPATKRYKKKTETNTAPNPILRTIEPSPIKNDKRTR